MASRTQTTKKRRSPRSRGTPKQIEQALFKVIKELECRVIENISLEELTRITHALATASGAWVRVNDHGEVMKRVEQLEALMDKDNVS